MSLYFIGKYIDTQNGPKRIAVCETHLTLETAELLTTHHNRDLGHTVDDDFVFTRTTATPFYFMYDDEDDTEAYERDRRDVMAQDSDKDYRLGHNR
jgi:hypothetical protein